jgi:tetratricopeptide (TPR) repeat protein
MAQGGRLADHHRRFGDVLHLLGWTSGAAHAYGTAVARRPGSAEAHLRLGDALGSVGRWEEAARAYGSAARLAPGDVESRAGLVLALARSRRPGECLAALDQLLRLRPLEVDLRLLRAALLSRLRRGPESVRALRRAAELPPPPRTRRFLLGEAVLGRGEWDRLLDRHRAAHLVSRGAEEVPAREGRSRLNQPPVVEGAPAPPVARTRVGRGLRTPVSVLVRSALDYVDARTRRLARISGAVCLGVARPLARSTPHVAIRLLRKGQALRAAPAFAGPRAPLGALPLPRRG